MSDDSVLIHLPLASPGHNAPATKMSLDDPSAPISLFAPQISPAPPLWAALDAMHGLDPGGASACFTSSERLSDTEFADDFDPSSPPGPSSFLTAADDMEARLSRPSPHTRIPEAETPRKSGGGGAGGDGAGGMCWSPAWLPSEDDIFNDPISGDSTMLHDAPPFAGNSGGSGGSRGYQGESGPGMGTGAMSAGSGGGNRGMGGMSGGNSPFGVNLSGTDSAGLLLSRTSPMPGMTVQDLIMAVDSVSFATPAPHGSRAIGGGSDGGSFNNALSYTNGPSSNNAPSSYTNAPSYTNGPSYPANQSPEPWSLTSYYDTPVSDILCETGQASTCPSSIGPSSTSDVRVSPTPQSDLFPGNAGPAPIACSPSTYRGLAYNEARRAVRGNLMDRLNARENDTRPLDAPQQPLLQQQQQQQQQQPQPQPQQYNPSSQQQQMQQPQSQMQQQQQQAQYGRPPFSSPAPAPAPAPAADASAAPNAPRASSNSPSLAAAAAAAAAPAAATAAGSPAFSNASTPVIAAAAAPRAPPTPLSHAPLSLPASRFGSGGNGSSSAYQSSNGSTPHSSGAPYSGSHTPRAARPQDVSRHASSTGNAPMTVKEEATGAGSPGGGAGASRAGASVDLTCEEDELKLSLDAAEETEGGGAAAGAGGGKGGVVKQATLTNDPNPAGHSDTVMQLQYAGGNGPLGFGYKMVPRSASMSTTPSSLPSLGAGGGSSATGSASAAAAAAAAQAARGAGDMGGFMDDMEEDDDDDMMGGGSGYSRKRGFVQNAAASAARKRRHDMNHRVKRLLDLVPVSNKRDTAAMLLEVIQLVQSTIAQIKEITLGEDCPAAERACGVCKEEPLSSLTHHAPASSGISLAASAAAEKQQQQQQQMTASQSGAASTFSNSTPAAAAAAAAAPADSQPQQQQQSGALAPSTATSAAPVENSPNSKQSARAAQAAKLRMRRKMQQARLEAERRGTGGAGAGGKDGGSGRTGASGGSGGNKGGGGGGGGGEREKGPMKTLAVRGFAIVSAKCANIVAAKVVVPDFQV
ncbi:unnamed protein product [Closterium sp. Naga37s-1]|nr:unnamed protein product [Closterium sp. Naga37s-1]